MSKFFFFLLAAFFCIQLSLASEETVSDETLVTYGKYTEAAGPGGPPSNVQAFLGLDGFPYKKQLVFCIKKPFASRCKCFFNWLVYCWGKPVEQQHEMCPCSAWCRWW